MNHIDVVEVTNPNGYIVQELTIDDASYGQWLDKHTEGSEDEHIAAFIRPFSELLFAWSHDIDWNNLEISILDDFDEERAVFRKYGLKCDEL